MYNLAYLATASPEIIADYKRRRCGWCLWQKPCKYKTCTNGLYSNSNELVYGFKNDNGQYEEWLIERKPYYESGIINKIQRISNEKEKSI